MSITLRSKALIQGVNNVEIVKYLYQNIPVLSLYLIGEYGCCIFNSPYTVSTFTLAPADVQK